MTSSMTPKFSELLAVVNAERFAAIAHVTQVLRCAVGRAAMTGAWYLDVPLAVTGAYTYEVHDALRRRGYSVVMAQEWMRVSW